MNRLNTLSTFATTPKRRKRASTFPSHQIRCDLDRYFVKGVLFEVA